MTITLYEMSASPNARKVRLLAAELGIALNRVEMDFKSGALHKPEFLARYPNAKIPTIDDDGFALWESGAILRWLAAKKPERALLPGDPKQLALVDQWQLWFESQPEPALNALAFERIIKPWIGMPGNDPGIIREAEAALARYLPVLDAQLGGRDYVLGDLTIVDFVAAPRLDNAERFGVVLGPYANIATWLARLRAKPYWKDA